MIPHCLQFPTDNTNARYLTEDEIMLYLSYLAGQQSQDYGCLYRLSCQKPHQAALYASGAELLLQGTKLFQGYPIAIILISSQLKHLHILPINVHFHFGGVTFRWYATVFLIHPLQATLFSLTVHTKGRSLL